MQRIFLAAIFIFLHTFVEADAFVIDINDAHRNDSTGVLTERFFTKVYAELGIQPEFVYYPSKRGLRMVDRGELDAEAGRFDLVGSLYPNLIKVSQAMFTVHVGLYCINSPSCEATKDDAIVLLDGIESAASFCEAKGFNCRSESDVASIVRLLESGVADAFLSTTISAAGVVCTAKTDVISFLELPEFKRQSFHYVNRKHSALVPKLEQAIQKLRSLQPGYEQLSSLRTALDYPCDKSVSIVAR